jgi:hypothetical protein
MCTEEIQKIFDKYSYIEGLRSEIEDILNPYLNEILDADKLNDILYIDDMEYDIIRRNFINIEMRMPNYNSNIDICTVLIYQTPNGRKTIKPIKERPQIKCETCGKLFDKSYMCSCGRCYDCCDCDTM